MSCEVAHELVGPRDGPPVILSCSLGTDRSMWDPQTPALAGRHLVIRYDLRGHGQSPAPPGPYAISDLGEDLLALMDRLEIGRASLCGLSIGAMTSIWVAAHAPERVDRLVLCCTSARFGPEAAEVYRARAVTVREHTVDAVADGALERWFTPAFREAQPELMAQIRRGLTETSPEGYASCCEALAALDLLGVLGSISAPTLVIAGAEDPATPPDHGRAIAAGVAGARFELIEGAAHLANIEKAEQVTPLIAGFIDAEQEGR
ncbi:MAG: 3-oxoadipate enol-lactonase [Solirubrobacteraceae bacterium]